MDFKYPYTDFHELNLDWFMARFKELVEEWNSVKDDWNSLHDFVQNYFDNLNVQTEINNKINAMIADGSFAIIVTPLVDAALPTIVDGKLPAVVAAQIGAVVASQIDAVVAGQLPAVAAAAAAQEVGTWLAAHIDPDTGYVIDDSMSVPNAAADAAAVGSLLDELDTKIVREIDMIYDDYVDIPLTWTSGEYVNNLGVIVANASYAAVEDYIPIYADTSIVLNCWAGGTAVVCAIYKKDKTFDHYITTQGMSTVKITDDGYIRLSNTPAQISNSDCYLHMYRYENISKLREYVDNVNDSILRGYDPVNISGWSQGYINNDGTAGSWNAACYTATALRFTKNKYTIAVKTGYQMKLGQYDVASGTTGFKWIVSIWSTGNIDFFPAPDKFYRFVITKTDQSTLPPASVDADAVTYSKYDIADDVYITVNNGDSILSAVHQAYQKSIKNIVVEAGTYDIIAEYESYYGASYFSDYADNYNGFANGRFDAGIYLDNINIRFSPGAVVTAEYTGNNTFVTSFFAAFACGDNVVIDGLNLSCKNLRYGVHPDFSHIGSNLSRFTLINSDLDNFREGDTSINNNCAVGAGLPLHGEWNIENCIFRSQTSNRVLRIHNNVNADARSHIVVKNCYIDGNGHIEINKYGASTDVTTAFVTGCSMVSPAECNYDSPLYSNDNVDLISFNNEIRS